MTEPVSYEYAVVRLVPRVERGEFLNVGVVLFCKTRRFLAARVELRRERLACFPPLPDLRGVEEHLALIPAICMGEEGTGPIGKLSLAERFHWLVAPSSTVIQTSPAHAGLCDDPQAVLDHLFGSLVRLYRDEET